MQICYHDYQQTISSIFHHNNQATEIIG